MIGLAIPELDRPYFGQLAARVIARSADLGYRVAIEQTGAALRASSPPSHSPALSTAMA